MLKRTVSIVITLFLLSNAAMAKGRTIYTSSVKNWTPASLEQLIDACEEGSTIVFDADYDYTVDRCLKPKVSITIKGNGKTLRTINKYNYVISLFDVHDINHFIIEDLILDGGCDVYNKRGSIPQEFFCTVRNVAIVTFKNCVFQNIWSSYPNWKPGDEPYTMWIENYDRFSFEKNRVLDCRCAEFLKVIQPKDNNSKNKIATICNNSFFFVSTSSAVEVRFSRFRINNNEFGVTEGSTINAYGFDSEIVNNVFHGSHNSSSIDLSEQFAFEYVSHHILVKGNYSEFSRYGFLMADTVHNIKIIKNEYRADVVKEEEFLRYDTIWTPTDRINDRALYLSNSLSDILIRANLFVGANALMMSSSIQPRKNIIIENNTIKNVSNPIRSSLIISCVDGMVIKNNKFINTGRTLSYLSDPQFIVIGPTNSADSTKRFVRGLSIIGNSFSFDDEEVKNTYILAHTIYDNRNCNTLSSLSNIVVKNNRSSVKGDILLVSDDFRPDVKESLISIRNNRFNKGIVSGNMFSVQAMGEINSNGKLVPNTTVTYKGKLYYVVIGGKAALGDVVNNEGYIKTGQAVLREIKQ